MTLFQEMSRNEATPNTVTYTILIGGMSLTRRLVDAQNLFKEMRIHGLVPNEMTYSALLDGLCKNGHIYEAFGIVREMQGSNQGGVVE